MSTRLITAPTDYPITTEEARAQCRVDGTDEDTYIDSLIAAATAHVEDYTGRAIMTQTWELVLDAFADTMQIPRGPVRSITSVKYYDTDEVLQTLDITDYALDNVSDPAWVVRTTDATWPTVADGVNNVIIRYVAGYTVVPAAMVHAIKLLVSTWFDTRSGTSDKSVSVVPHAVAELLSNHRAYAF